jgi:hypothetical protein
MATQSFFAVGRASETIAVIRPVRPPFTAAEPPLGAFVLATADKPGFAFMRGSPALTIQVGGTTGGFYSDTNALYRGMGTVDTNLFVVIQDTSLSVPPGPQQPAPLHQQAISFAVRRRSPLVLRDLFGPWQAGFVLADSGSFDGKFAFFEFKGDGTGFFDNGAPPGQFRVVAPCTYVVRSDNLGGATPGDSFYEISFRPVPVFPSVTFRAYLSQNRRFLTGASTDIFRRFIVVGARRANTVDRAIPPGSSDTPINRSDLKVAMAVGAGAAPGTPTFAFSPIDSSVVRVAAFENLRDSGVQSAGIKRVFGSIDITPDTTITNPDSITLTIDLSGVAEVAAACSTALVPMVYDDTTALWTKIADTAIVKRCGGIVIFRPPHFSSFGIGVSDASSLTAAGGGACLIERAFGGAPPVLRALRRLRDAALGSVLGRALAALYYVAGGGGAP